MAEATVEIKLSLQITITPCSSDISKICAMRKKKQDSLAWFKLGESSPVSERVQSGSHSSAGLLTLLISVIWRRRGAKTSKKKRLCTNLECNVLQITDLVCAHGEKKRKTKGKWEMTACIYQ